MNRGCYECGKNILACICGSGCPCQQGELNTHLNVIPNPKHEAEITTSEIREVKWVNVRGREEHEAVLKDKALCEELGLDQIYETIVYLKRWGSWLSE